MSASRRRAVGVAIVVVLTSPAYALAQEEETEEERRRLEQVPEPTPEPTPEQPDVVAPTVPTETPAAPPPPVTEEPPAEPKVEAQTEETAENAEAEASRRFVTYDSAEGFRLKSEDGNYMLRIGLATGLKLEPSWLDGDAQKTGSLAFVRPALRGHFFRPWLSYTAAFELASETPFLLAANVDVKPVDEIGFRFGQQGTPVSRHTTFAPQTIFFPDYAAIAGHFWSGRQRGLTAYGSAFEGYLDYWAGLYGSAPLREVSSEPRNYIGEGRVTVNPMGPTNPNELPFTPDGEALPGRVSFTLQGYHGRMQQTEENTDLTNSPLDTQQSTLLQRTTTIGGDVWAQWGRFILNAEYYWRYLGAIQGAPSYRSQGMWGQILANVYDEKIGVGGRFGWLDPSSELSSDRVVEVEGAVAWFIRPTELSLKLRYGWLHQDSPDPAILASKGTYFVLPYPTGTAHIVTLQLTLAF